MVKLALCVLAAGMCADYASAYLPIPCPPEPPIAIALDQSAAVFLGSVVSTKREVWTVRLRPAGNAGLPLLPGVEVVAQGKRSKPRRGGFPMIATTLRVEQAWKGARIGQRIVVHVPPRYVWRSRTKGTRQTWTSEVHAPFDVGEQVLVWASHSDRHPGRLIVPNCSRTRTAALGASDIDSLGSIHGERSP